MGAFKADEIPQYVYDRLAKMLLPEIQKFYSTERGERLYEEYKSKMENESEESK